MNVPDRCVAVRPPDWRQGRAKLTPPQAIPMTRLQQTGYIRASDS
jgi:hypothetical protein